jgi:hypothetical protein
MLTQRRKAAENFPDWNLSGFAPLREKSAQLQAASAHVAVNVRSTLTCFPAPPARVASRCSVSGAGDSSV